MPPACAIFILALNDEVLRAGLIKNALSGKPLRKRVVKKISLKVTQKH
jgi:hypothetical protein